MTQTMLDQIGGEPGLSELVTHFYDLVETEPEAARLRIHAKSSSTSFAASWAGGLTILARRCGLGRLVRDGVGRRFLLGQ